MLDTHFLQPCPVCGRHLEIRTEYLKKEVICSHCCGNFVASDSGLGAQSFKEIAHSNIESRFMDQPNASRGKWKMDQTHSARRLSSKWSSKLFILGLFAFSILFGSDLSYGQRGGRGGGGGRAGGGARAPQGFSRPSPNISRPSPNISRPAQGMNRSNVRQSDPRTRIPQGNQAGFNRPQSFNDPGPRSVPKVKLDSPLGSRTGGIDRPNASSLQETKNRLSDLNAGNSDKYWGQGRQFGGGSNFDATGENLRDRFAGKDILSNQRPGEPRPGDMKPGQRLDPTDRFQPGERRPSAGQLPSDSRLAGRFEDRMNNREDWKSFNDIDRNTINNIQNNFYGYGHIWSNGWYANHPWAWCPGSVIPPSDWWKPVFWGNVISWGAGYLWGSAADSYPPSEPVYYNYGDNITYSDSGMVYVNDVPYVSTEEYYNQGVAIANEGADNDGSSDLLQTTPPATTSNSEEEKAANEWMPLGTFAVLSDPQQTSSQIVLQLAMNKKGVIRGNLYNQVTDKVQPLEGAVDNETQRVVFRISGDKTNMAECGLWNLTQESLSALVHKGKDETLTRTLIRLTDPNKESVDSGRKPGRIPVAIRGNGAGRN